MSADRRDRRDDAAEGEPTPDAPGPRAPLDPYRPVAEQLGLTPPAEVARAALNRAAAAARARGVRPGAPGRPRQVRTSGPTSGAHADGRDPALLGDTLARLAAERGWSAELSVGGVVGRWREVVGDQVADHCTPETFEDGRLVIRTDSTTWATNLRLLVPELLGRLEVELGSGVVREVTVLGPAGPGWGRGGRRVPGRGPRDTYG